METEDQVVPGSSHWSGDHSQAGSGGGSEDGPPLLTSTPAIGLTERVSHRDSGYRSPHVGDTGSYTSPPIGNTLGPNSPENTDHDGRLIHRFSFTADQEGGEGGEVGGGEGGLSEGEDSAFIDSSEQVGVLLDSQDVLLDSEDYFPPHDTLDTRDDWDTQDSTEHMSDSYVQDISVLGQSDPGHRGVSYLEQSMGDLENTRSVSHVTERRTEGQAPQNQSVGRGDWGNTVQAPAHSSHRTMELGPSHQGHTRPLFDLDPSTEGGRSYNATAAIPVPRSHPPPHLRHYNPEFHTPPRAYRRPMRHATSTPAQLMDQGTVSQTQYSKTGARPRTGQGGDTEAVHLHNTGPRTRVHSEHQPPTHPAPDTETTPADRRRSAPAVMYTAQLFGQELRRIGDEFEGTYNSPGQQEEGNTDVPVRPMRTSNRRSFPGANNQEVRWWEKIIQFFPIQRASHTMERHRTAPGPLCGRLTEENSDEDEEGGSESEGTADTSGVTEL